MTVPVTLVTIIFKGRSLVLNTGLRKDKLLYPSIPIGFLEDVLQAARYRKLDVDTLLQAKGLSQNMLQESGIRISVQKYSEVLRLLGRTTNDAFFGFLSKPIPIKAFECFCLSIVGCRNLEEFIDQANDFYGLFSDEFRWCLDETGSDIQLSIQLERTLPIDYRFIIQSLLLMSIRLYGWLLGEDPELKSVNFSFQKNSTDESLSYLYGNRIDYRCQTDAIRMDNTYADARLSCTREQITLMLREKRLLFLISRHKNPLSQEVRRLLLNSKNEQWLEVDEVASLLNSNPNQMWRRLKKEGSSFIEIRDQIKRDWALVLLEDPANTVETVADQLRYSDVSAFRKAFKKWTGMQPVQYRESLV